MCPLSTNKGCNQRLRLRLILGFLDFVRQRIPENPRSLGELCYSRNHGSCQHFFGPMEKYALFAGVHSEMDYLKRNLKFYFVFVNKKYTLILFLSARRFRNSNFRHSKETPSINKQWHWTCIVFDFWPANRRGVGFDKTKASLTAMSKTNETYSISASIICVHFVPSLETHKN